MRSPQHALFPWAHHDRAEEFSRFRQFASRWRPLARGARDEDSDEFGSFGAGSDGVNSMPRPTWSPWLWVK